MCLYHAERKNIKTDNFSAEKVSPKSRPLPPSDSHQRSRLAVGDELRPKSSKCEVHTTSESPAVTFYPHSIDQEIIRDTSFAPTFFGSPCDALNFFESYSNHVSLSHFPFRMFFFVGRRRVPTRGATLKKKKKARLPLLCQILSACKHTNQAQRELL